MKPFDLQVNGYAGTDFNRDGLTAEALHHACQCLLEDGCTQILATFITDDLNAMADRMATLVSLREADELARSVIAGIHIEGPFISPEKGYVGAHPAQHVRPGTLEDAKLLLDAAGGLTRVVTLAPEHDANFLTIEFLANHGITVSAGHCNPSLDTLRAATEHGLTMFTHVGNGCPMLMHRHDNIIHRALALRDKLWLCFIPDGVHIDFYSLKNYLAVAGLEKTIFVTDAISAARLGPGTYSLAGWDIRVGDDLVARSPDGSHFVGSTVTVPRILSAGQEQLGLSPAELERLLDTNPRQAVKIPE